MSILGHAHTVNRKVRTVEPAQVAARASLLVRQVGGVIAVVVEFPRKSQNFGRAEVNTKPTAFATVPINKDSAPKFASPWCGWSLRHVHLVGANGVCPKPNAARPYPRPTAGAGFLGLTGTLCPFPYPQSEIVHFCIHFGISGEGSDASPRAKMAGPGSSNAGRVPK